MDYIRHHSIAVSSQDGEKIKIIHDLALSIFGKKQTTEIIGPVRNGYISFFIGPDGYEEDRDDSDIGDEKRKTFITIIRTLKYLKYCEFIWGGDTGYAGFIRHN